MILFESVRWKNFLSTGNQYTEMNLNTHSTNLIIVESPAKARTLKRYLGDNYYIEASVGHIRDLPSKEIGIDVENNFQPTYVVSKGKNKVIRELKSKAKKMRRSMACL